MRTFWAGAAIGFAAGVLVTLVGLIGGGLLLGEWARREMGVAALPSLELPDLRDTTSYGRAPAAWSLHDPEGAVLPDSALRGRVLVIHRWATWCPPCVAELPELQTLADSLAPAGVRVLCVTDEEPKHVKRFLAGRGLRLEFAVCREPWPEEFRAAALPATFVVRRDGWIVYRRLGAARWSTESARRLLAGLL